MHDLVSFIFFPRFHGESEIVAMEEKYFARLIAGRSAYSNVAREMVNVFKRSGFEKMEKVMLIRLPNENHLDPRDQPGDALMC